MTDVPDTIPRGLLWVRLGALACALLGALAFSHLVTLPAMSLCAFQVWTGQPCPGCGMTRSIVRLSHGDVGASLGYHPLGIVLAGGLVLALVGTVVGLLKGNDPVQRFLERRGLIAMVGFVGALLVVWVVRAWIVPEWGAVLR
jgi:hypothetical protein